MPAYRKIKAKWDIFTGEISLNTDYMKSRETVDVELAVTNSGARYALPTGWALNLTVKPEGLTDNAALIAVTSWSAGSTTGVYTASAKVLSSTDLDTYLGINATTTDDVAEKPGELDIYYSVSGTMAAKSDTVAITLKPDVGRTDDGTPTGTAVSITASGYTMSTARLLGRTTAATGAIEEISVGAGLTLSDGTIIAEVTQSEIELKAPLASPTFTGSPGVSGGLSFSSSVTPSTAFPTLGAFGTFGGTGTGVTLVGDGTYVGMANVVEGAGQVGLSFRVNRAGSPSTGGTEALRLSHTGAATFPGAVTAANLSGTNTGDQTVPLVAMLASDFTLTPYEYQAAPTGVSVTPGTYIVRIHAVLGFSEAGGSVLVTTNLTNGLGGPSVSGSIVVAGASDSAFFSNATVGGSGQESITASELQCYNPIIFFQLIGWVTFSAAGVFKLAGNHYQDGTEVAKLLKGSFIELHPQ